MKETNYKTIIMILHILRERDVDYSYKNTINDKYFWPLRVPKSSARQKL